MRIIIVGLGVQGAKRRVCAGSAVVATVDTVRPADYQDVRDVPLTTFEAACICTPNDAKLEIIRYLIANRKHVLVEKPLLADKCTLTEIAHFARKQRVICYTAYNHRFEPLVQRLREVIARGELGEVIGARLYYGNGTAHEVQRSNWRDCGLGALTDLGSHLVDLAQYVTGRMPPALQLFVSKSAETIATDYGFFGTDGPPALLFETTLLSWRNIFLIDVQGSAGSAHVVGLCKWGTASLTVRQRVQPSGKPTEWTETLQCPDSSWASEYHYFQALCRTGYTDMGRDISIGSLFAHLEHCVQARTRR